MTTDAPQFTGYDWLKWAEENRVMGSFAGAEPKTIYTNMPLPPDWNFSETVNLREFIVAAGDWLLSLPESERESACIDAEAGEGGWSVEVRVYSSRQETAEEMKERVERDHAEFRAREIQSLEREHEQYERLKAKFG